MTRPTARHTSLLAVLLSIGTACNEPSGESNDTGSPPVFGTDPVHALYIGHSLSLIHI